VDADDGRGELANASVRFAPCEHLLGHVLHAMDDVRDALVVAEHGAVEGAPVALLEATALLRGTPDVVLLNGHPIRCPRRERSAERGTEVPGPGGFGIVGIVGEHIEECPTDDVFALRHRRAQVRLAHGDDGEIGREHQVAARRRLEERLEVGLRHRAAG
jgi:hypothetical protein